MLLDIGNKADGVVVRLHLRPAGNRSCARGLRIRIYRIPFISSRKSAAAYTTPNGISFQRKTRPLGETKASSS